MGRDLEQHLEHILTEVVPERGAAQDGLDVDYVAEIEARPQPPHLVRGLEQWNAGHFYEQHETLEWLWRATADPVRDAFKGIIQSGVGAYHVLQNNRRGALGKWTGAIGYLEPFAGLHPYGIAVGHLRTQIERLRQALLDDEDPDWPAFHARVRALRVHWQPKVAEPRVTALLRRFDRAWYASDSPLSVEASLEGITETEASWHLETDVPTLRQVLREIGARKMVAADRCFGEGALAPGVPTAARDAVTPPESWRKFMRWLTEAHEAVREPLGFLRDEELDEKRPILRSGTPAEGVPAGAATIRRIIENNVEHDFFDAGRIRMLRRIYECTRTDVPVVPVTAHQ